MELIRRERNYGIDCLRILSMFMVVLLHVLGKGGILASTEKLSLGYEIAWFAETAVYCAVNCYALISGFVMYGSKPKYSSLALLWLQVAFYTVLITCIYAIAHPETITEFSFRNAFFPVSTRQYWYFSSYFALFFFIPLINTAMENMKKSQLTVLVCAIILLFTVFPTYFNIDPYGLETGYTLMWMIALYILGAYIRKYDVPSKISGYVAIIGYFICVIISFAFKYGLDKGYEIEYQLINYSSPTILFSAVFLLIAFSRMKTGKLLSKVIAFLAPLSFGVYLIHSQKLIWNNWLLQKYSYIAEYSPVLLILAALGAALFVFLSGMCIEWGRQQLFKLLRVKKAVLFIENKIITKLKGKETEEI